MRNENEKIDEKEIYFYIFRLNDLEDSGEYPEHSCFFQMSNYYYCRKNFFFILGFHKTIFSYEPNTRCYIASLFL